MPGLRLHFVWGQPAFDSRSEDGSYVPVVKTGRHVEGSRLRRRKSAAAKTQSRANFIGTRPRIFTMTLRGEAVGVEVVPVIGTATHVNFEITITRRGKILDWVLTRAELECIGRAAGMHAKQETSH